MLVGVVVEAFDDGFFEGSVHALDLAVGPGMFWFGQTVVDVGFGAGELEGVGAEKLSLLKSELDLGDCGASIAGVVKWTPLSVSTVWILYGTASIKALRKSAETRVVARSCSSTKANLEVRSMATNR